MELISGIKMLQALLDKYRSDGKSIGFVPTMGALHEGHGSLLQRSVSENDITVCSIFVNPIQFNNSADLKNYPRDLEADKKILNALGCDILFNPNVNEIYPEKPQETWSFGILEETMEGKYRPGHFSGVATVVNRFFDIVQPNSAYFGMKDYQQLLIVKRLAKQSHPAIKIIGCPTIRLENGLAMSSRNELLNKQDKEKAGIIFKVLQEISENKGEVDLQGFITEKISEINSQEGFEVEYLQVADPETLQPMKSWSKQDSCICCIALFVNNVRLIDNLLF